MGKNKMNKLDLILLVGIGVIAILGALMDIFHMKEVNFPVNSCVSIYASYALWIILMIYSLFKYKENEDKPQYVRWFMVFILSFLHIMFVIVGFIIGNILINIFNI